MAVSCDEAISASGTTVNRVGDRFASAFAPARDDVRMTRTEIDGVLSAAQTVDAYMDLSSRGYSTSPRVHAYGTDVAGNLHLIISGEKDGRAGFYYVGPGG